RSGWGSRVHGIVITECISVVDYERDMDYITHQPRSRGAPPEAILGGARQVASPARLMHRPHRAEAQETRSSGQCDPCGKEGCRMTPEGIPDNGKHGHEPQNRHGGASRGERFLLSGNAGVSN